MNKFGEGLCKYRKRSGVSQEWLASACNLSLKMISRYEHGSCIPRRRTFNRLAFALDLSASDIESLWFEKLVDAIRNSDGVTPVYTRDGKLHN